MQNSGYALCQISNSFLLILLLHIYQMSYIDIVVNERLFFTTCFDSTHVKEQLIKAIITMDLFYLFFLFLKLNLCFKIMHYWIPSIKVGHLQAVISGYDGHCSSCHRALKALFCLLLNRRPAAEFFCHCTSPLSCNGRSNQDTMPHCGG